MSGTECFFDSNVMLYLLSADPAKADKAEALVSKGGHISVQVLNEVASIATRKLKMTHLEVTEVLTSLRALCQVSPLTEATHELGMQIAGRYRLSVYDAMIAASAVGAGCQTLFSEDLQQGLKINGTLQVSNPFAG